MKDERVKMTLLLSSETIKLIKQYAYETTGDTNVSKAVMSMAKEYGKNNTQSKKQKNT